MIGMFRAGALPDVGVKAKFPFFAQ